MPPEGHKLGTAQEWVRRAKSNLTLTSWPKLEQILLGRFVFRSRADCAESHQGSASVEGSKVQVCSRQAELLTLLEQNSVTIPETVRAAAALTDYSVEARYPGPFEPVTESEFTEALRIAKAVVAWAEAQIIT